MTRSVSPARQADQPGSLATAIGMMLFALVMFDVMGAIIKYLGTTYPPQQLSASRNFFGIIPSLIILYGSKSWHEAGRPWVISQWKLGLLRGGFIAFAQFCFYLSLVKMEFAIATTIAFAGPLVITALSIPILGNVIGIWRWSAVFIGFIGVLMVIRPEGDVFDWYSLLPLGAAVGYALSSVTSRLFDEEVPTATVNLYSVIGALGGSVLVMLVSGGYLAVQSWADWLWIITMGLCGGTAVYFMVHAYRLTEPGNLSPFEYFGIPFSFALGWVFFDETPFGQLFPGVLLIIGGGLLIVWRERQKNAAKAANSGH